MLKDGKSGWTTCVDCGRFLNVDETRYRAVDVPPR
jgi:hypothetical protein